MKRTAGPNILVLGGGFGGLEAGRYARIRLPEASVTLVSDRDYFLFKPNTIYIPFGMDPGKATFRLAGPVRRENIHFRQARVREIDPLSRRVFVEEREGAVSLPYDFLVVATGLNTKPTEIPGLDKCSETNWTPEAMLRLRANMHKLLEDARAGERRRVLFLVSPDNKYSGPLYEMTLLLDTWLRRKHAREQIEVAFSTCEESYLQAFGPRLNEVVTSEFHTREIDGHTGFTIDYIEPGRAFYRNGEALAFDLLIAFPPHVGSTHYGGLPTDERGFLAVEPASRQVISNPDVYAVGDAADFPIKQALSAFIQADAAVEHLSARVRGDQPGPSFDPVSMHLMGRFDNAERLHAPLSVIGQDVGPTGASSEPSGIYRIAATPLWTLTRRMVGAYLPWRFKAGNPFHAYAPWKGLEMGLRLAPGVNGALGLSPT